MLRGYRLTISSVGMSCPPSRTRCRTLWIEQGDKPAGFAPFDDTRQIGASRKGGFKRKIISFRYFPVQSFKKYLACSQQSRLVVEGRQSLCDFIRVDEIMAGHDPRKILQRKRGFSGPIRTGHHIAMRLFSVFHTSSPSFRVLYGLIYHANQTFQFAVSMIHLKSSVFRHKCPFFC